MPRGGWRGLKALYVAVTLLLIAGLGGEVLLRGERWRAERDAEQYLSRSLYGHSWERQAAARPLWRHGRVWEEYKPNARLDLTVGGESYSVQINSLGFRTREFAAKKPPGTLRVICLGGSTTVGGRTNDETYPAILERGLRQHHPHLSLEVLNLGISGTTSGYWLERGEKLFGFEPDLIVDYGAINDLAWRHLPRYAASHPWRLTLQRSLLLERLLPLAPRDFDPFFRETLENFRTMGEMCRERGVRYLVASFAAPDYGAAPRSFQRYLDVNLDFWTAHLPLHDYREYGALIARYNELFELFVYEHHMAHVLVHRLLREPLLFTDICHLTPEGIALLAEAFLPAVGRILEERTPGPASP
jgi:lysophospholipase L1-like esterase